MSHIEIKDLNEDITVTEEELKHVKGGVYDLRYFQSSPSTYKLDSAIDYNYYKF
ncbi:MAG: hypothetical protein KF886_19935 [Candidatus Hydrogenedentes bacterium]|nr:hypothetical protein [Candidatus Hydrogenedentota bacterium]